jgi:hypothetical protein
VEVGVLGHVGFAILKEPPFRRVVKPILQALPVTTSVKALWDAAERPHYLFGVLYAAEQAKREGWSAVSVIEFGVAEGDGLLTLQKHAAAVERDTGIEIHIYGFDRGKGLPQGTGDYRDHPDFWMPGDYPMDEPALRRQLTARTTLVIGDLSATAVTQRLAAPIGFVAVDLDLYSSTADALRILLRSDVQLLHRVALYFDDVDTVYNHRFAGELLAIDEFNVNSKNVKIDQWRGLQSGRPFHDADWLRMMYLAHNLPAISQVKLTRGPARMR